MPVFEKLNCISSCNTYIVWQNAIQHMNTVSSKKNIHIHILWGVQNIQIHKVGLVSTILKLFLSEIPKQKSERFVTTKQVKENLEIGLIRNS